MTEDKIQKLLDRYPNIWKSKPAVMSWLRGGIRRSLWKNSPQKIDFINKNRIKIPNPNPNGRVKEVWGGKCYLTGVLLPVSELEVDHIQGNHSLRDLSDLQPFIEGIALITDDDLAFISKDAHKVKSQAEKKGISFEDAQIEKIVIDLQNKKMDKDWLEARSVIPESNQKKRRQQIIEILTIENKKR